MAEKQTTEQPPVGEGQAVQQAFLKTVYISGTPLVWTVGQSSQYVTRDGTKRVGQVKGIGIVKPPIPEGYNGPPIFQVQVHIQYDDYVDIIIAEDHLVVKVVEVSALAVVQAPKLVVPKR